MRESISALLLGEPSGNVLHNCQMAAFGAEQFGEEAIRSRLRAQPHTVSDGARFMETGRQLALFDDDIAVFTDVYEGWFGRIWRLGPGQPAAVERPVAVAFDTDLQQQRGGLFWRAQDHPELDSSLFEGVEAASRQLSEGVPGEQQTAYRSRAFLLRAFGRQERGAALFAVHRLGSDAVRTAGFGLAAALFSNGRTQIVHDRAGEDALTQVPWRPRV